MIEIWKDIPGIPGYQVSSLGRVKSVARSVDVARGENGIKRKVQERILVSTKTYTSGRQHYCTVRLAGKTRAVHRLVALAFLGAPPFGPKSEVNHKDGNRHNNALVNLEWVNKSMNEKHSQRLRANRKARGITKAEPGKK